MSFKIDTSSFDNGTERLQSKLIAAIGMYASTKSRELESQMKTNRPWTDRTGMAKARLNSQVSQPASDRFRITLAHCVEYGLWLELAHNKNYAIIGPTIRQESPKILSDMKGLMEKTKGV